MGKKKKIEKSIESLEKQIEIHREKIRVHGGESDFVKDYWEKQIEIFEGVIRKKKGKLKGC